MPEKTIDYPSNAELLFNILEQLKSINKKLDEHYTGMEIKKIAKIRRPEK